MSVEVTTQYNGYNKYTFKINQGRILEDFVKLALNSLQSQFHIPHPLEYKHVTLDGKEVKLNTRLNLNQELHRINIDLIK
jgi:hypothetical protein